MIFNELLFYAAYHIHRANNDNVKKCICTFYTDIEIVEAKKCLWDNLEEILGRYRDRNNSDNRAASSQHVTDILTALRKLDEISQLPTIAALNYDRIPKVEPEECNVAFMAQRLQKLENVIQNYDERIADLRTDISRVQLDVQKKSTHKNQHEENTQIGRSRTISDSILQMSSTSQDPAFISKSRPGGVGNTAEENSHHIAHFRGKAKPRSSYQERKRNSSNHQTSQLRSVGLNPQDERRNSSRPTTGETYDISYAQKVALDPYDAGDGFQYPRQFVKRQRHRQAWGVGNRECVSSVDSDALRGAPSPSRYIFVYRVLEGNTVAIKDYCLKQGIQVRHVSLRSNAQAKYRSFVVEVSVNDQKKVINGNFWPNGIHVRPYRGEISQQTSSGNNG